MTVRSAWHLPTGQTREDTRLAVGLGMASAGPLLTRAGCVFGGLQLTGTAATGMQAKLSPGQVWIAGTSTGSQGGYPVTVDSDTLLTVADGHASLPRVDALVVRVYDNDYDGLGKYEATLELLQGTPAGSPTAPAVPKNAELLYEIAVPAGASAAKGITWASAITDRRRYTAALGGIVPAVGGAPHNGAYVGQYRDVGGRLERWDGAQWTKFIPNAVLMHTADWGGTTSTSYVEVLPIDTTVPLVATFTAPPSRWVSLTFGAFSAADGDTTAYISFRLRLQSGTEVLAPSDDRAAILVGPARASISTCFPVGNLTPGAVYTATAAYRSSVAGTRAHFDNRFIRIDPVA
ncbi:hypothetical protein B7755_046520 [Streptomyces sp. NBS 14/10]|uniref:hypothetical protein n=1 Tax=Streptomyces sp. NBS 14/10 TaxID=1945643 RepID=UPI000B7CDCC5|nr:hypothetical protein [Streptomyces sp. NBS 14/10]KAK1184892.1 hypothetical protein B7755_046520 [Streptomyces sp. NBS 14/10]NUP45476.1 hypothetical protein [Streptomyces sp.]NUS85888.1 hypothetical protein [Streptomyces sp.]